MKNFLGILLFLTAFVFLQMACAPPKPAFEFTDHQLKISIDPDTNQFFAVDTVSVRYHKHIDSVFFLLRDSLRVERVGVGHQSFRLEPVTAREAIKFLALLTGRDSGALEHAQIVKVRVPKSLFTPALEIRYSGIIDPMHELRLWYPQTPHAPATVGITALLPAQFRLTQPGQVVDESTDGHWRICRMQVKEPQLDCALQIELCEPL